MFKRIFGKKTAADKRLNDLKCRKISYVDCGIDELKEGMSADVTHILKLTPVNYYAVKNEYILALIYTNADYTENYVQFKRISFEKQTGETEIYALDGVTVSKALAKVGIMITLPEGK